MRRNTIAPIRTPPAASAIAQRASLIDHASASEAAARTPHAEGVTSRNDRETFRSSPTIPDFSATAIARPEQLAPQNPTAVPRRTWQTSAAHWGRTVYAVVAATLLIRLLFGLRSVLPPEATSPTQSIRLLPKPGIPRTGSQYRDPFSYRLRETGNRSPARIRCDSHTERAARRPGPRSGTLAAT